MQDRPVRFGVLGTASITEAMIPAIEACPDATVAAIASRSSDKAEAWATRYGIPSWYGSYHALLAEADIDCCYIPLPNTLHLPWTLRALEAGLHVLVEKPLAMDAAEVMEIIEVARARKRHVQEAYMYRHHPLYERLRGLLSEGTIGRLTAVDAVFTFFLDDPSELPASQELGGGSLRDVGGYCVHACRMLTGEEPQEAHAVARWGAVDEHLVGTLRFPGGVLGKIEASIDASERHRLELVGTTGSVVVDRPWVQGSEPVSLRIARWEQADELVRVDGADAYTLQVTDFVRAVRGAQMPTWTLDDALGTARALDALLASARPPRADS